jgi:hypothetical protein
VGNGRSRDRDSTSNHPFLNMEDQTTEVNPQITDTPPIEGFPIGNGIIPVIAAGAAWIGRKWFDERRALQSSKHEAELADERNDYSITIELLKANATAQKELFKLLGQQSQSLQQQGAAIRELSAQLQQFNSSLRGKIVDSYPARTAGPIGQVKPEFSQPEEKKK